jgi:Protein of unknown function (DUF1573)
MSLRSTNVLRSVLFGISVCVAIAVIVYAAKELSSPSSSADASDARGLICDEPIYNYGPVTPDHSAGLQHRFVVKNASARPIRITGNVPTCGCTVAKISDAPIASGGSTEVLVTTYWDPEPLGDRSVRVVLLTDHPASPTLTLEVKATIRGKDEGPAGN